MTVLSRLQHTFVEEKTVLSRLQHRIVLSMDYGTPGTYFSSWLPYSLQHSFHTIWSPSENRVRFPPEILSWRERRVVKGGAGLRASMVQILVKPDAKLALARPNRQAGTATLKSKGLPHEMVLFFIFMWVVYLHKIYMKKVRGGIFSWCAQKMNGLCTTYFTFSFLLVAKSLGGTFNEPRRSSLREKKSVDQNLVILSL